MRAFRRPGGGHQTRRLWSTYVSSRGWRMRAGSTVEQQLDEMLLNAVNLHHDRHGDFLQAVMLSNIANGHSAGQQFSPAIALWPKGMVVYVVATSEQHMAAPERQIRYKGLLLRKVLVDELSTGALEGALTRAGFQAQRLSVWLLQAKHTEDAEELRNITADVSECAAQGSLLLGHAVGWEGSEVRESLASNGFMGSVTDWDADAENKAAVPHCIFAAQQQQFSLAQTGLYNRHVAAANDTDEDFLGHFS